MIIVRRQKQFSIATSAVLHIVVIALAIVFKDLQWKSSTHKFDVVANSVRVDVVAMPKLTVQELKQMQKGAVEEEPEEVSVQPTAKDDFLVKKKKVDFMSLMKKLSQKEVEKSDAKKKVVAQKKGNKLGKFSGDIKKLVLSGNRLREGTSIAGTGVGINDGAFSLYLQKLPDWVRGKWKLPSYLADKGLRCRIRIFIGENGQLIRSEILESSGQNEYDQRALEAIKLSVPFPPVGENIAARALRGDIVLGFPL